MNCWIKLPAISFALVLLAVGCTSAAKSGSVTQDPFPEAILAHQTFRVFLTGTETDFLGRVFRNPQAQVLGEKTWAGKSVSGGGQSLEIQYSKSQAISLNTRIPKVELKAGLGYTDDVSLELVLDGVRIHQLTRPVMIQEFRADPEAGKSDFIVSLVSADSIVIRAKDNSGAVIGIEGKIKNMFRDGDASISGKYEYDKRLKGVIVAKKSIIGYMLTKPTAADLARR